LTEIQKITLRDILREYGLPERKIEDVFLLLRFKPEEVQLSFYYVSMGYTQEETAVMLDIPQQKVSRIISKKCGEIKEYLKIDQT